MSKSLIYINDLDTLDTTLLNKLGLKRRFTNNDDINTILDQGIYWWYNDIPINIPTTSACILLVINMVAYTVQLAFQVGTNTLYMQCMYNYGENLTGWDSISKNSVLDGLNTIISNLQGKVLWNISTAGLSVDFVRQTISLNDDISNYNYYEIEFALNNHNAEFKASRFKTGKIPTNTFIRMIYSGMRNHFRVTGVPSGTSLEIGDGQYFVSYGVTGGTVDNSYIIPVRVIGYKYL